MRFYQVLAVMIPALALLFIVSKHLFRQRRLRARNPRQP